MGAPRAARLSGGAPGVRSRPRRGRGGRAARRDADGRSTSSASSTRPRRPGPAPSNLDATRAAWHVGLAATRLALGEFDAAVRHCDLALDRDPSFARAHFNRGLAHQLTLEPDEAVADFTRGHRGRPGLRRGVQQSRGSSSPAAAPTRTASRTFRRRPAWRRPSPARAPTRRPRTTRWATRPWPSPQLNEAIRIERENPLFYKNRGKIYLDLDQVTQANADFEEALRLAPGDPELLRLTRETDRASGEEVER